MDAIKRLLLAYRGRMKRSGWIVWLTMLFIPFCASCFIFGSVINGLGSAGIIDLPTPELTLTALPSTDTLAPTFEPTSTKILLPTNTVGVTNTPIPQNTIAPIATDTPTPTTVPPTSTPEPTPTVIAPTLVPEPTFDAVGQCSSDLYSCVDFVPVSSAQNMFNACRNAGYDDPHRLDFDNDNKACEQPDLTAERNYYNPPTPTVVLLSPTLVPTQQVVWCECGGDTYNCPSFPLPNGTTARQCFEYCQASGAGDIHNLDGDADGNFCEG